MEDYKPIFRETFDYLARHIIKLDPQEACEDFNEIAARHGPDDFLIDMLGAALKELGSNHFKKDAAGVIKIKGRKE